MSEKKSELAIVNLAVVYDDEEEPRFKQGTMLRIKGKFSDGDSEKTRTFSEIVTWNCDLGDVKVSDIVEEAARAVRIKMQKLRDKGRQAVLDLDGKTVKYDAIETMVAADGVDKKVKILIGMGLSEKQARKIVENPALLKQVLGDD